MQGAVNATHGKESSGNAGSPAVRVMTRLAAMVLLSAVLSSCGSLPSSGPLATSIESEAPNSAVSPYEIIDIDASAVNALALFEPARFSARFTSRNPAPQQVIVVGDQVTVTIWEAANGGLFSGQATSGGSTAKSTTIPPQIVGRDGTVTVPYAGAVPASGRRPNDVAKAIEQRLKDKAIEPQVLVTVGQQGAFAATVSGDVTGAGRVTLNAKGDRLLEVIAQSGGVKALPHETSVRLIRGNVSETVRLETILRLPQENVFVYPGDQIFVFRDPQTYVALGAVTAQKDYPIDTQPMTLSQALAKAGGLKDTQADASAVFMFRFESPAVMRALRPSIKIVGNQPVPVIYRLNFGNPESYFHAQQVRVRHQDLIYVANAPSVQISKFLNVVRAATSTVGGLRSAQLLVSD